MDNFYLNFIWNIIEPKFFLISSIGILMFICCALIFTSFVSNIQDNSPIKPILSIVFVVIIFFVFMYKVNLDLKKDYVKDINISINQHKQVYSKLTKSTVLNRNLVDVVIDNETYELIVNKDTKYINDSNDNPYIIYEKISFYAPSKWFIEKESTNKINQNIVYIAKEIHGLIEDKEKIKLEEEY